MVRILASVSTFVLVFPLFAQIPDRVMVRNFQSRNDVLVYGQELEKGEKLDQEKKPLILSLHGLMAGPYAQNKILNFVPKLDRGFILAVPQGTIGFAGGRYWNAMDFCCGPQPRQVDDVKYLMGVLDTLIKDYPVDPNRVYLVGHSNGGFMSHRLICDHGHRFRGIVSFAGSSFKDLANCQLKGPKKVLLIHGTSDTIIRYVGTKMYPGVEELSQWWADHNKCSGSPEVTHDDLFYSEVGSTRYKTTYFRWKNCDQLGSTQLWRIEHGSHLHQVNSEYIDKILNFILKEN